ncbi:LysM peptidoglycan-binding domain-containing protein, partial [Nitrincola sp.]
MSTKNQRTNQMEAGSPIQDLWNKLLADGYISADLKTLNLAATNSLGSQPITELLNDKNLFPTNSIVMELTNAAPPSSGNEIVLAGVIVGHSFNFDSPNASATFTISGTNTAQLEVTTVAPQGSKTLGTAFPGLKPANPSTYGASTSSPAAETTFSTSTFNAASSDAGIIVTFNGQPVPNYAYQRMWKTSPAPMSGSITNWPTADASSSPAFNLVSPNTTALPTAGLLPLKAGINLVSSATGLDTSHGTALFDTGTLNPAIVNLTFPILESSTQPTLSSGALNLALNSVADIASLLMGEAADACVPNRFPLGDGFVLSRLEFILNYEADKTLVSSATISVQTEITLLPLGLAILEGVDFTFQIARDLSGYVFINGHFKLNNNENLKFLGGLSFPVLDGGADRGADGVTLSASNAVEIDILQLLNIIPGLPTLPKSGIVTPVGGLSASVTPATGAYTFRGLIQPSGDPWTIEFGRGIQGISLNSLQLNLNRTPTDLTAKIIAETEFLGIPLSVSALTSTQSKSWIFTGLLVSDEPVSLKNIASQLLPFDCSALPDVQLAALDAQFDTSDNTFMVHTSLLWKMDILPVTISADLLIQSQRADKSAPAEYSGHLSGVVDINNMILTCSYVFSPTTTDITFAYRDLTVVYHKEDTDPFVAVSLDNSNVGDLFAFLLSFAQPGRDISLGEPWNALEQISLPNLTVKVHLKTKKIEVDMDLDIDLGFIKIDNFTLTYVKQYGKPKFNLALTCEFLGQGYGGDNGEPLSWDPINEQPPVVPGTGTQVFDLEYLGIGQRMSIRGDIPPTMDGVIEKLEAALVPIGNPTDNPANQLPGLAYDAGSDWMIGTRFTAMSTVNLSIVFNDPRVYGLLIQLAGSRAGVLAGLRFEIIYRKISDDVGVYHIELTLPDQMRHLQFGAVSITLPIVTIDIYTNGNFRIDAGFPPSLTDFSRSFSVQVFPFIGYGGFYFGVLNGETSSTIPQISNGDFSPVIEFGFALQVGVGKTLSLGILSGGISITVGGMLQGTLSWFNPTDQSLPAKDYFHLRGTLAVIGQVYASVDFGIIQADVSLTVYVSADIDMESYREILLNVSAGVRVRVSIKIIFVRIHFSFSATITESFTIGSNTPTPWILKAPSNDDEVQRSIYRARSPFVRQRQYGQLRSRPARAMSAKRVLRRYTVGEGSPINVDVTAIPLFSQAKGSDFAFNGAPKPPSEGKNAVLALLLGLETSTSPQSATNQLLSLMSDWLAETIDHEQGSLSAAVVDEILEALKAATASTDIFSYENLQQFFVDHNIKFNLKERPTEDPGNGDEVPMAVMAMIPELSLTTPDFSINFLKDRIPQAGYEQQIQEYFADLAAQFAERNGWNARAAQNNEAEDSMATLIFRYYFLMVARSLMQQTKSFLTEAELPLPEGLAEHGSLSSLANLFNNDYTARDADTIAKIATYFGISADVLLAANPDYAQSEPRVGDPVFIPLQSVVYTSQGGDTLDALAQCFGLTTTELQAANPNVDFNSLPTGTKVTVPAMRILHTSLQGETLASIASDFGIPAQTLSDANPGVDFNPLAKGTTLLVPLVVSAYAVAESNQKKAGILRDGLSLALGDISFLTQNSNTLTSLASQFGIDVQNFVAVNQENRGLFRQGQVIALGDLSYTTREGDSFNGVYAYWYSLNDNVTAAQLFEQNGKLELSAPQTITIPRTTDRDQSVSVDTAKPLSTFIADNKTTLEELLVSNPSIRLQAGQVMKLPTVSAICSNSFILSYSAVVGDTPTTLAAKLFAPATTAQSAAVQSIRQWNGSVTADHQFAASTTVAIPYFTTIGNISRQFGMSVQDLSSKTTMTTAEGLLAANVAMLATNVTHTVSVEDSLAGITQSYDLSLEQLASRISNVAGLFADNANSLAVKAVPGMRQSLLAQMMSSTGNYTNALNMSTRFMLNGLRLPDPNFIELKSMVDDTDTAYPLYALIGQEYPLKAPDPSKGYELTLSSTDVPWVKAPTDGLKIDLLPEEIGRIAQFETTAIDTTGIVPDSIPLYTYVPDRQTVSATVTWATEDMPEGISVSNQRVNTPRLWSMPDALISAIAESPDRMLPYQACFGTPTTDGGVNTTKLQAARYATAIDVTIQKPADGQLGTYLVSGTDQAGLQRLMNLWSYMVTDSTINGSIYIAYAAQNALAAGGTQTTDLLNRSQTFLLKTNLSTESHGEFQTLIRSSAVEMLNTGLVDDSLATLETVDTRDFLQLLWECSIVKSGGYYLNYVKEDGTPGLPGTLFRDGRQATLKVIVVLNNQTVNDAIAQAFNNVLIVGDNVDQSAHSTFFEAVTHTIASTDTFDRIAQSAPAQLGLTGASLAEINQLVMGILRPGSVVSGHVVTRSDSLLSIAQNTGQTVSELTNHLAPVPDILTTGAKLQLAGKPVQTTNAGDTLASISREYDFLDPASLVSLNANRANLLAVGQNMLLPMGGSYPIGKNDTFASVAHAKNVDMSLLGDLNATNDILMAGVPITVAGNTLRLSASMPPGHAGFTITRNNPEVVGSEETETSALNTLFNLAGFQLIGNDILKASNEGLPAGPTNDTDDTVWDYRQIMSLLAFAQNNRAIVNDHLAPAKGNPYSAVAVGGQAGISLDLQDILGNRTEGSHLNNATSDTGYTDELLGLAAWPSVTSSYRFAPIEGAGPTLFVSAQLAPSQFLPDASAVAMPGGLPSELSVTSAATRSVKAQLQYQTVSYQLQQPDITARLSTTLGDMENSTALGQSIRYDLLGMANSAYIFMSIAGTIEQTRVRLGPNATFKNFGDLLANYPVITEDLAKVNEQARADLLFGIGTPLTLPLNTITKTGDSPQAIINRLNNEIDLATLAGNNKSLSVAQDTAFRTKSRSVTMDVPGQALSALAQEFGCAVATTAGGVPGLATSNAKVQLGKGISLTYTDPVSGKTYEYSNSPDGDTETERSLKTAATYFTNVINPDNDPSAPVVTVDEVAMANMYLNGIFETGQLLSVEAVIAHSGDTIASLVSDFGAPDGDSSDPITNFITANVNVPNSWPLGTSLFIKDDTVTIEEGQTLSDIAQSHSATVGQVISDNPKVAFEDNTGLLIPYSGDNQSIQAGTVEIGSGQSLNDLVTATGSDNGSTLLNANLNIPALFSDAVIKGPSGTINPTLQDTPQSVSNATGLTMQKLAEQIGGETDTLRARSTMITGVISSQEGESVEGLGLRLNSTSADVIAANACLPSLIQPGQTITVSSMQFSVEPNDTLSLLLARINNQLTAKKEDVLSIAEFALTAASLKLSKRTIITPVAIVSIQAAVTAHLEQSILNLGVNLSVSRDPAYAASGFENAPRVISSNASIAPAPFAADAQTNKKSLEQFASDFESAYPGLKVATGPKVTQGQKMLKRASMKAAVANSSTGSKDKSIWIVNFSDSGANMSYAIEDKSARYFSIPPLTTTAWNGAADEWTYNSSDGLKMTKSSSQFRSADPDQWQQQLFSAIDLVLSPEYAVAGSRNEKTQAAIQTIISAKQKIANGLSQTVAPIVASVNDGLKEAAEAMEQQLLIALGNAYSTQSLIQFDVSISGGGVIPDTTTAPQISGKLNAQVINTGALSRSLQAGDDDTNPMGPLAELAGVSRQYLAFIIAGTKNIISSGLSIKLKTGDKAAYKTQTSDTLSSIAANFSLTASELATQMEIIGATAPLFRSGTAINVTSTVAPADLTSVTAVADWSNVEISDVITANLDRSNFFRSGTAVTIGDDTFTPSPTDTLQAVVDHFGGDVTTFATNLGSIDAGSQTGSYSLNETEPPHGLVLIPQISLSTAKAPLASGGSRLTTAFGVKDPSVQRNVTLNLDYHVNQLEFDRHAITGVQGYQDSSWLSFVIPLDNAGNTDGAAGQQQIPVPLRGYPEPALVSKQNATGSYPSQDKVATLAQWDYTFTAARQFAAQDTMTLEVLFNHPDGGVNSPLAGDSRYDTIIELLASFSTVWTEISPDLAILKEVTAEVAPTNATHAVLALAKAAELIGKAWESLGLMNFAESLPERGYIYQVSILTKGLPAKISSISMDRIGQKVDFSIDPDDFVFNCTDQEIVPEFVSDLDKKQVAPELSALFSDYGFELGDEEQVDIGTSGSDWMIYAPNAQQVFSADENIAAPQTFRVQYQDKTKALMVSRQLLWPDITIEDISGQQPSKKPKLIGSRQMGTKLIFDIKGQTIPLSGVLTMGLDYYRLNVMGLQDAWGGTSISRNANLLAGEQINSAFVYQTPLTMFPTRISPLIAETEIAELQGDTLEDALSKLFQILTAGQAAILGSSKRKMRVTATYWSGSDPSEDPTTTPLRNVTPLTLSPLYSFEVTKDWTAGKFTTQLAAQMRQQATALGV